MGKKRDGKPRGRMTAYAFFVQTCREEHKKKHPGEQVVFSEFSKKCSEKWKVPYFKNKGFHRNFKFKLPCGSLVVQLVCREVLFKF